MLDRLPAELFLQVCHHLVSGLRNEYTQFGPSYRFSLKGLHGLSSTCKRTRQLAQPYLFQTCIKSENRHDGTTHQMQHPNAHFRLFLRTILERPDLAACVNMAVMYRWESNETLENRWTIPTPPANDLAQLYIEAALNHSLPDDEHQQYWMDCLQRGFEDAEVALLIASSPNLRTLKIALPDPEDDEMNECEFFYDAVINSALRKDTKLANGALFGLQNLKRIHLKHHSEPYFTYGYPLSVVSQIFQFPALELFEGVGVEEKEDTVLDWTCPPRSSNVSIIILHDSAVSAAAIETLASSCKKLNTLSLKYATFADILRGLEVSWVGICEALKCQRENLETLVLHGGDTELDEDLSTSDPMRSHEQWDIQGTIDTLKDFPALKRLSCDLWTLTGLEPPPEDTDWELDLLDVWPQGSLETITLAGCCDLLVVPHLRSLLDHISETWPYLKRIESSILPIPEDDEEEECPKFYRESQLALLKADFAAVGVDYHYYQQDLEQG